MNEESWCKLRAAEKVKGKVCKMLAYIWGNASEGLIIQFKIWKKVIQKYLLLKDNGGMPSKLFRESEVQLTLSGSVKYKDQWIIVS